MRMVRAVVGALLLVIAVPLLVVGAGLWEVGRHRAADGSFAARTAPVTSPNVAVVSWDLDGLLRHEAPFARGGHTTLTVAAPGRFVGLGPRDAVGRYLATGGWLAVNRVRLARGELPVDTTVVPPPASADPAAVDPPADQPFWRMRSANGSLTFPPSTLRGQDLALVIMNPDARPGVDGRVTIAVHPRWLSRTIWGVILLGGVFLLTGTGVLAWPRPRREPAVAVPVRSIGRSMVRSVGRARVPKLATGRACVPLQLPVAIQAATVEPVTVELEWPPRGPAATRTLAPVRARD